MLVLMFLCLSLEWSLLTFVLSLSRVDLLLNVNRPVGLCGGDRSVINRYHIELNASTILLSLTIILSLILVPFLVYIYIHTHTHVLPFSRVHV